METFPLKGSGTSASPANHTYNSVQVRNKLFIVTKNVFAKSNFDKLYVSKIYIKILGRDHDLMTKAYQVVLSVLNTLVQKFSYHRIIIYA